MKANSLYSFVFLLAIPLLAIAQEDMYQLRFYENLGIKDAKHEITLNNLNQEDEKDFWADQRAFESLLEQTNPKGHQSYLNGKHRVYRKHQIHCKNGCDHSDEFIARMTFYLLNGNSFADIELVSTINQRQP